MPKLADRLYKFNGKEDGQIKFKSSIAVGKDGVFYASIPDEFGNDEEFIKVATSVHVFIDSHKGQKITWRLISDTMSDIDDKMERIFEAWLKCETTEELVLDCHAIATCHYVNDIDGNPHPNGSVAEKVNRELGEEAKYGMHGCHWNEILTAEHRFSSQTYPNDYTIGVKARIWKKVTHTRGGHVTVELRRPEDEELGEWGKLLNEFAHVSLPDNSRRMPYTEEAAKFFVVTMLALCRMHQQVMDFFGGDDFIDRFQKILEAGSVPALMPARNEQS